MRKVILNKLDDIEKKYGITILYACESGSRAWGFPSPDSDYDVRFIYRQSLSHYLSIYQKEDQLSFPINDELDIYGWDISKVLQLMSRSNSTPFEWLQSPILYRENEVFQKRTWDLCQHYFCLRTNVHHYLGIARGAMASMEGDGIKIKKLFYVIRPLLAALWCVEKREIAPMNIIPMMSLFPDEIRERVQNLMELKSTKAEGFLIEIDSSLKEWINTTFDYCIKKSSVEDKAVFDFTLADDYFRKIVLE